MFGVNVIQIACGGHHTLFLNNKGKVFSCGNNSYGQLGHKFSHNLSVPQEIYNISKKKIHKIVAGWNHSLIFVLPYYVYSTGLGKYGELGHGDFEMRKGFAFIEHLAGKNIVDIFSGGYHSWFLFDNEEPDTDFDPPSPLLSTPIQSVDEDSHKLRIPRSVDVKTKKLCTAPRAGIDIILPIK